MPDRNGNPRAGENVNITYSDDTRRNFTVVEIHYSLETVTLKSVDRRADGAELLDKDFVDFEDKWTDKFGGCWMLEETL